MKFGIIALAGLLLTVSLINGDVYLHNLRGSNNRLNEAGTARSNNNRMFDSQVGRSWFILNYADIIGCHEKSVDFN